MPANNREIRILPSAEAIAEAAATGFLKAADDAVRAGPHEIGVTFVNGLLDSFFRTWSLSR